MNILDAFKDLPVFYKYRRFDNKERSLDIIRNGELWHTSISKLNDPFDCAVSYTLDASMLDRRKHIRDAVKGMFPNASQKERRAKVREAVRNTSAYNWPEKAKQAIQETRENAFGICCLSAPRDNLLLWAHYADEHRGLCIGLSTEKLDRVSMELVSNKMLLDCLKVEYSRDMPQINLVDSMLSPDYQEDIITMISTKSIDWEYEEEYRLVYWDHPNELLSVGQDAIAEVILGCRCSDEDRDKTLAIVPDGVPVYQAKKEERTFGLDLELIQ